MKRILMVLLLVGSIGCTKKDTTPILHVTHADRCDRPSIVGYIGKLEYALTVEHPPMYMACPGVLGMDAVGQDFKATVDAQRGEMTLVIAGKPTVLEIVGIRENPKPMTVQ